MDRASVAPGEVSSRHQDLQTCSSFELFVAFDTASSVVVLLFTDNFLVEARKFEFPAWICTINSQQLNTSAAIVPCPNTIIPELARAAFFVMLIMPMALADLLS